MFTKAGGKSKRFVSIALIVCLAVLVFSYCAFANDVGISTLSPASQLKSDNFKESVGAHYSFILNKQAVSKGTLETILDPATSEAYIQELISEKVFKRIGEGHTVAVFTDAEKDIVLKIPFVYTSLSQEDREALDNNLFLSRLDTFLQRYAPRKFMDYIKRSIKYLLYKLKGTVPEYEVLKGYEIAQKYNFKSVVRSRVVSNFSKEINIKVLPFARIFLNEPPRIIINEYIDEEKVLLNKVKKAIEADDLESAKNLCRLGFEQQLALWKEGGFDLDPGINILDNMAVISKDEAKLIDAGWLTDDKEKAKQFILEKRQELEQILSSLKDRTLSENLTFLSGSNNRILYMLTRIKRDLAGRSGEEFVLYFLSLIDEYFKIENLEQKSELELAEEEFNIYSPLGAMLVLSAVKKQIYLHNLTFHICAGLKYRVNPLRCLNSFADTARGEGRIIFPSLQLSMIDLIEEAI